MEKIVVGATPDVAFRIPYSADEVDVLYVTFASAENCKTIVEKALSDDNVEFNDKTVILHLSQEDTLAFERCGVSRCQVQMRCKLNNGKAVVSKIYKLLVSHILKGGVI